MSRTDSNISHVGTIPGLQLNAAHSQGVYLYDSTTTNGFFYERRLDTTQKTTRFSFLLHSKVFARIHIS